MINSKFYKSMHKEKDRYYKELETVKRKIREDLDDDDFVHMAKLVAEANEITGNLMTIEKMIDEFDYEFYKEDE